jgi:hypothetical protein
MKGRRINHSHRPASRTRTDCVSASRTIRAGIVASIAGDLLQGLVSVASAGDLLRPASRPLPRPLRQPRARRAAARRGDEPWGRARAAQEERMLAQLGAAHRQALSGGSARLQTLRRAARGRGLRHRFVAIRQILTISISVPWRGDGRRSMPTSRIRRSREGVGRCEAQAPALLDAPFRSLPGFKRQEAGPAPGRGSAAGEGSRPGSALVPRIARPGRTSHSGVARRPVSAAAESGRARGSRAPAPGPVGGS